jgi:hypothetical protein
VPEQSPFRVMLIFFRGLATSVIFGIVGTLLVFYIEGEPDALEFFRAYNSSFKTVISLP